MELEKYVVVIGGLNMDIAGISGPVYHERDSNIGKWWFFLVINFHRVFRT